MLIFGKPNAKLKKLAKKTGRKMLSFSLPAGWTCPGAKDCLSKADQATGKITDGPATEFRCFAASDEARHKQARKSRWDNLEQIKSCGRSVERITALLLASLPEKITLVRIHVSGDFFSESYFRAWINVAKQRPGCVFYGYTKSIPLWVKLRGLIPANLILTASKGGKWDSLIEENSLRFAQVVYSEAQAKELGLEIDHDDSHAMNNGPSFALLIHGTQPPGSDASRHLMELRKQGEYGYGERADARRVSLAMV